MGDGVIEKHDMEQRLPFIRSPCVMLEKLQGVVLMVVITLLLLSSLAPGPKVALLLAALGLCYTQIRLLRANWSGIGDRGGLRIQPMQSRIRLDKGSDGHPNEVVDCRVAYHGSRLIVLAVEGPAYSGSAFSGGLAWLAYRHLPVFASCLGMDDFQCLSVAAIASGAQRGGR